ncbi:SDR family oxidoreductase [Algoriphagus chordae]|uniref:NAD(P)-dependent dehydrogenase (Short-subunit alcohol dehydrogenase family) n=1 Tax=Algoriphagus chordae TaxID=237019 RepID=A0A2W7R056_9BACT|nr:SDR family oxidoreductase [Algoriphagus chordae]PZX54183.1 NAD(P)-dependent dehydrogenase (short-subunit alcohol dehydrogenase family) [Algoriphagus chordae]
MSSSLFSLEGKKIAFSGATGVLGQSMSLYLAKEGAEVLILGRNPAKVADLVKEIKDTGGKAFGYICDVTDEASIQGAYAEIENEHGYIDILINAAGGNMPGAVITPDKTLKDLELDSLRKVMDLNYLGTAIPSQVLFPLMLKNGKGNIINISSMAASRPMTRVLGYASAKAAIDNLTKFLSVELCTKHGAGYRVNALAPGFFLTEQNRALLTEADGSLTGRGNQIIKHTPMDRFGKPEDLLGTLHWLCADASAFVTGTIVAVDGGFGAYSGV